MSSLNPGQPVILLTAPKHFCSMNSLRFTGRQKYAIFCSTQLLGALFFYFFERFFIVVANEADRLMGFLNVVVKCAGRC